MGEMEPLDAEQAALIGRGGESHLFLVGFVRTGFCWMK